MMKRNPILKRVYFDTNIYNKILEDSKKNEQIKNAINSRKIGIFISNANQEELISAYENVPEKAQKLFRLTLEICLHRATQLTAFLLEAELRHLVDPSVRINIYSNKEGYNENFIRYWKLLAINPTAKKKEISETYKYIKDDKYDFLAHMKVAKQEIYKLAKKEKLNTISFEKYCDNAFNKSDIVNNMIKSFLKRISDSKLTMDIVKNNLLKMDGFRHYLYLYIGLSHYHIIGGKPDRGDSRDMHHAIYAGYSDIFVSDEFNPSKFKLLKYLKHVPGNKHLYLNLEEFLNYLPTLKH